MNDLILYDENGDETSNEKQAYAKVIKTKTSERYYIATHNNLPYNPIGSNSNRRHNINLVFKKTNQETFIMYKIYLETKNLAYFTRTNRRFLND